MKRHLMLLSLLGIALSCFSATPLADEITLRNRDSVGLIEAIHRIRETRIGDNRVGRRHASLAAAGAVLNHGMLTLQGSDLYDNEVVDKLGGLASVGVVNLYGGRVHGASLRDQVLDELPAMASSGSTVTGCTSTDGRHYRPGWRKPTFSGKKGRCADAEPEQRSADPDHCGVSA